MANETLLATLNEALRDVSEKLAQSDAALARMRGELATFTDILQLARHRESQANDAYDEVFKKYREILASATSLPENTYPVIGKIGELSAEQIKTHDDRLAAKQAVTKYERQVRAAEGALAMQESKHKSLQKARDDLTWQIKKLSAPRR
jgi:chromosome segregation ATPase